MRKEITGFWDDSGISWTICKHTAPHSRQITTSTPHHSIFTGWMLFLMPNHQCQITEGNHHNIVPVLNHVAMHIIRIDAAYCYRCIMVRSVGLSVKLCVCHDNEPPKQLNRLRRHLECGLRGAQKNHELDGDPGAPKGIGTLGDIIPDA